MYRLNEKQGALIEQIRRLADENIAPMRQKSMKRAAFRGRT